MATGPGSKKRTRPAPPPSEIESDGALETPEPETEPSPADAATSPPGPSSSAGYTVVARRYRPQRFEDVVGQDHVVQSLRNAIRLKRLAQAYLFCGTRGVGKTSMARIFAKCLNCIGTTDGPTVDPCQKCDVCRMIEIGHDVDVIEIDGASNNGVEQVRELRQNAALRPSRSRFKIYYIDEVHMLSTGAFNALLKTLEEPPPHVKFFFATTEANKIPITVLSRCQRYDFAGITPEAIVATLKGICEREGVEAEPEALQVVARRAGGSMRDAQSLLEQLLASGSANLTVEVVHSLLGTPSDERLMSMLEALAQHRAGDVLTLLDQAATEGVQPGDFLAGVLEFLRDAMVLSVGAGGILMAVTPRQRPQLEKIVQGWSTDAILAALQILAEARSRMRGVSHGRLLTEIALVRVARLENLTELSELVGRLEMLESGAGEPRRIEAPSVKKKPPADERPGEPSSSVGFAGEPPPKTVPKQEMGQAASSATADGSKAGATPPKATPASRTDPGTTAEVSRATGGLGQPEVPAAGSTPQASSGPPLELETIKGIWPELVKKVGPTLGIKLVTTEPIAIEPPDILVFAAKAGYNSSLPDQCGTEDARGRIGEALQHLIHLRLTVRYLNLARTESSVAPEPEPAARRPDLLAADPMIQKVVELFEARPFHLEYEQGPE